MCSIEAISHEMADQSSTLTLKENRNRSCLCRAVRKVAFFGRLGFRSILFQAVPDSIGTEHASEKKRKHPKSAIKKGKNKNAPDFLILFECCLKLCFHIPVGAECSHGCVRG